jgi:hypothetical protein
MFRTIAFVSAGILVAGSAALVALPAAAERPGPAAAQKRTTTGHSGPDVSGPVAAYGITGDRSCDLIEVRGRTLRHTTLRPGAAGRRVLDPAGLPAFRADDFLTREVVLTDDEARAVARLVAREHHRGVTPSGGTGRELLQTRMPFGPPRTVVWDGGPDAPPLAATLRELARVKSGGFVDVSPAGGTR